MKGSYYLLADVETGGLDETKNPVTEICFQVLDDMGKQIDCYTSRIRVYNNLVLDKQAVDKTGITESVLEATGKPFKTVVDECIAFIAKYTPSHYDKPIFVAHNVLFDFCFIQELFKRAGKDFRSLIKDSVGCTLFLSRMFNNTNGVYKLDTVCKSFGVEVVDAHSAKGDVDAMAKTLEKMMLSIRNKAIDKQGEEVSDVTFKFNM